MKKKRMAQIKSSKVAKRRRSDQPLLPAETTISFSALNMDVLEQIFLRLPSHLVVCVCQSVCLQWKEVIDRASFWRERCKREGYRPSDQSKIPQDWRLFYFLCKQRRNLIKNPCGEERLNGWNIERNGGDGWWVGPLRTEHPDKDVKKDYATSFEMCLKSQLIDLKKEGYTSSFMDTFQPDIKISDWYSPRSDCHSQYEVRVDLLNQNMEVVQRFAPETVMCYIEEWNEMTHLFQNYGPGVRYIKFVHGGKDLRWWKGFYGIRLTNTCVEICPAHEA